MKHQLFKKGTYVQLDVGQSHLDVVGKIKDATIQKKRIVCEEIFNIPQQAIELEPKLLVIPENSEISPYLLDEESIFREELINKWENILKESNKLYASVYDLDTPSKEYKDLFYKLNQGAK
jgi:hypothetical protein